VTCDLIILLKNRRAVRAESNELPSKTSFETIDEQVR